MRLLPSLLTTLGILAFPSLTPAQSVTWGNIPGEPIFDSSGKKLAGSWQFELGVFLPGFFPTDDNIVDWVANWLPLDKAEYNEKIGYFSSRAPVTEPQAAGLQAYIWVYNGRKYNPGTEWLLITDRDGNHSNDWMIPNRSTDPTAGIIDWRVSRATTVLMGSAERVAATRPSKKKDEIPKTARVSYNTGPIPAVAILAAAKKTEAKEAEAAALAGEVAEDFVDE